MNISVKSLVMIATLFGGFISFGCSTPVDPSPPDYSRSTLLAAPETLRTGEATLILEPYLWRDFMPGPGRSGGSGLHGVITVVNTDSSGFPEGYTAAAAYVLTQTDSWRTYLEQDQASGNDDSWQRSWHFRRNGPRWPARITVNLVVLITTPDAEYLLRTPEAYISETH